jgi:hypothetical protein
MYAENPEICVAFQIFILITAGAQQSHIFRESTFDGLILNVFHFGMETVEQNFGHALISILK